MSRQNWVRLIQKIYEADPLLCPKCQGSMRIISFIEELDIIEKILRHLDFWDVRNPHGPRVCHGHCQPQGLGLHDFSVTPFIVPSKPFLPQLMILVLIILTTEFLCLLLYSNGGRVLTRFLEK